MSIEQKGGQPPDAESGDKFKKEDDAALAKVEGRQSETEWFLPFKGAQINKEECTVEPLKDHPGVYAIVDHSLHGCVGYTTNPDIHERPLQTR